MCSPSLPGSLINGSPTTIFSTGPTPTLAPDSPSPPSNMSSLTQSLVGTALSMGVSAVGAMLGNLSLITATTLPTSASAAASSVAASSPITSSTALQGKLLSIFQNSGVSGPSEMVVSGAGGNNSSSSGGSGLDSAAYILCMIQQKQQQLLDAAANGRSKLDDALGTAGGLLLGNSSSSATATAASSAVLDLEELYSREIIRLAMEFNRQQLTGQEILVIIMYGLVVLVSLFGNLLVCKVILFKRSMRRRTTNVFIANLTISDLLMTVFTIPMFIMRNILDNWPFGEILCKLVPFVQALSVYVSVLSMTMIAIDRYQALIKPLKRRMSHRVPKSVLITFIWSSAAILAAPNAVFNAVTEIKMLNTIVPSTVVSGETASGFEYHEEVLYRCKTVYPSDNELLYQRISTCVAFTAQFFVPLLIVGLCYTMIGLKISKRACIGETTVEQAATHLNAKRKTIKMLIFVVVCFAICWLPYNLLYLFKDFGDLNFSLTLHYLTHWLAMSSICYNPFIYFWLNNGYRQGILSVLTCCCTTSSMVAQSTDPEQNRTTIFQRSLSRSYSSGLQPTSSNLNYINNLNTNNNSSSSGGNNSHHHHHHHHNHQHHHHHSSSKSSGDKEINIARLKSNLLSVPSFSNGGGVSAGAGAGRQSSHHVTGDANNNSHAAANHQTSTAASNSNKSLLHSSSSSNGSVGTASHRHLQIIYISLKEKYSSNEGDDDHDPGTPEDIDDDDVNASNRKNETYKQRNKAGKSSTMARIAATEQLGNSDGEYFELMETLHLQENVDQQNMDDHDDYGLKFKSG